MQLGGSLQLQTRLGVKCISVAGEFELCRPMMFCNLCILMNSSYEKLTTSWIMVLLCA